VLDVDVDVDDEADADAITGTDVEARLLSHADMLVGFMSSGWEHKHSRFKKKSYEKRLRRTRTEPDEQIWTLMIQQCSMDQNDRPQGTTKMKEMNQTTMMMTRLNQMLIWMTTVIPIMKSATAHEQMPNGMS
jgi:hypothetical protein